MSTAAAVPLAFLVVLILMIGAGKRARLPEAALPAIKQVELKSGREILMRWLATTGTSVLILRRHRAAPPSWHVPTWSGEIAA